MEGTGFDGLDELGESSVQGTNSIEFGDGTNSLELGQSVSQLVSQTDSQTVSQTVSDCTPSSHRSIVHTCTVLILPPTIPPFSILFQPGDQDSQVTARTRDTQYGNDTEARLKEYEEVSVHTSFTHFLPSPPSIFSSCYSHTH